MLEKSTAIDNQNYIKKVNKKQAMKIIRHDKISTNMLKKKTAHNQIVFKNT